MVVGASGDVYDYVAHANVFGVGAVLVCCGLVVGESVEEFDELGLVCGTGVEGHDVRSKDPK